MTIKQDRDVQLRITFTPEDVECIEAIVQNFSAKLDRTGILSHILNEYRMAVGEEDIE